MKIDEILRVICTIIMIVSILVLVICPAQSSDLTSEHFDDVGNIGWIGTMIAVLISIIIFITTIIMNAIKDARDIIRDDIKDTKRIVEEAASSKAKCEEIK